MLSGWQLWPQGVDLTTAGTAAQQFNPLAAAQRSVGPPDTSRFVNYLSANVMPVWNLLNDQHRLDGPGAGGWTEQELRRFGIAIDDTGISGHPDLQTQVAALFSVVQSEEIEGSQVTTRDRVREVFRDNAHRDDLGALRAAIKGFGDNGPQVQFVGRPLFTLDDPNVLSAKDWEPTNQETGVHSLPLGCDGHGTAVASLAAGRANNGIGVAGIGYNVPIVAIRAGMPWDKPGTTYATNSQAHLEQALTAWEKWKAGVRTTDADLILHYEIVKALQLPVLNMSYGGPMLTYLKDRSGVTRPVLRQPAADEAIARVLSTGKTLGITAAGNHFQNYGRGARGRGADFVGSGERRPLSAPCGILLISRAPRVDLTAPYRADSEP